MQKWGPILRVLSKVDNITGTVEAVKSEDAAVVQVGPALPDKHAAKRQIYLQAPQGLFPAPIHPSKLQEGMGLSAFLASMHCKAQYQC